MCEIVQHAQKFREFEGKICANFFEKKFDNGGILWYNSARVRDRAPAIVKYLTVCRYKKTGVSACLNLNVIHRLSMYL